MKSIIKQGMGGLCDFLTGCINRGQRIMCWMETKNLYRIPKGQNTKEIKQEYRRYKAHLKQFGLKATKRDFYVFRSYLSDKGNDPAYIVPKYVVNNLITPVLNPGTSYSYFEDKNMGSKILPDEWIPDTLFRRMDSGWYNTGYQKVSFEEIKDELNRMPSGEAVIVKPAQNSSSGKAIRIFQHTDNRWFDISDRDADLWEALQKDWEKRDLIVQRVIRQSPRLNRLCDTSVNTFRTVIYNSPVDGECHLIWCGLRIGAKGSIVDNNHAGGLIFGVDKNGKLGKYGTDQYGNKYTEFNGINFAEEEFVFPEYDKIIGLAKKAAPYILPMRLIAFDITLDAAGKPLIIEYNIVAYSGWLCQFAGDYMLGDKTDEILKYVTDNRRRGKKVFYRLS